MKQYQINKAYGSLQRLSSMQMPIRDSRNIYMLIKSLEDAYNFALEQEQKLMAKYRGQYMEDGSIMFPTPDETTGFRNEISELNMLESDVIFSPVEINCDAFGEQTLSPMDIANLDGFIEFV